MTRKSHHVIPALRGGWNVKKWGATKAAKHFEKKVDAVTYGRKLSRTQSTELYIHGMDGTVQRRDSHGQDKSPPRDSH